MGFWVKAKRLVRWFKESYNANPVMFVLFIVAVCTQGPLLATITVWTGRLVDAAPPYLTGSMPVDNILQIAVTILVLGLVLIGGSYIKTLAEGRLQDSLILTIKRRLLHAAIETEYLAFLSSVKQDQLKRITSGFNMYLTFLLRETVSSLGNIWVIVSYLGVIGLSSGWFVALIGLILFVPVTIVNMRLARKEFLFYRHTSSEDRRIRYTEGLLTNTETAKEVKLFGLGSYLMDKWESTYREVKKTRSSLELVQQNWKSGIEMLALAVSGGLLVLIISQGDITPGVFLVVLTALISIHGSLFDISQSISQLTSSLDRLDEIDTFLHDIQPYRIPPKVGSQRGSKNVSLRPVSISIEDLSFSFDGGDTFVLEDINLDIPPGSQVALVGENGAGKSTLIHLLMGLYRPTRGSVLIGGVRPSDLDPEERHQIITGIFQTFGRYHGLTLKENITMSSFDKSDLHLPTFLEQTDLLPNMDDKLDLIVGKEFDGVELSGGQWQRVALARAMLMNTPVVVLDEPTASLDPLAEAGLFQRFMDILKGRTSVVATHRLGSTKSVNDIIVLKEGQVVERGSHTQLMQSCGHYWQMFEAQAEWYRDSQNGNQTKLG